MLKILDKAGNIRFIWKDGDQAPEEILLDEEEVEEPEEEKNEKGPEEGPHHVLL